MTKIELDVTLIDVSQPLRLSPGDKLMVFNDQLIGVLPKNREIGDSFLKTGVSVAFDPARVLRTLEEGGPATVRELNHRLGWTGTRAANQLSNWVERETASGRLLRVNPAEERFARVRLS